jgi:hypothetical protein
LVLSEVLVQTTAGPFKHFVVGEVSKDKEHESESLNEERTCQKHLKSEDKGCCLKDQEIASSVEN